MLGRALLKAVRQIKKIELLQISGKYRKKFTEDIILSKLSFHHFRLIYEICWFVVSALKDILVLSLRDCVVSSSVFKNVVEFAPWMLFGNS